MTTSRDPIYPWTFARVSVPKPWAGDRLSAWLGSVESRVPSGTGETIEVASHGRAHTPIRSGAATGKSISDMIRQHGAEAVVGFGAEDFPLVLKFLDTSEPLSVQVHPSDGWRAPGSRGKDECWLVLAAEADACVWQGVKPGVSESDFWNLIEAGRVDEVMIRRPVRAGDFIENPAGMIHAIGPGLVLAEWQQASDVTFRIWDWGGRSEPGWEGVESRATPRPLHSAEAKRAAKLSLVPTPSVRVDGQGRVELLAGRTFSVASYRGSEGAAVLCADAGRARLYTCLDGSATVGDVRIARGESVLFAAALDRVSISGSGAWRVAEARLV